VRGFQDVARIKVWPVCPEYADLSPRKPLEFSGGDEMGFSRRGDFGDAFGWRVRNVIGWTASALILVSACYGAASVVAAVPVSEPSPLEPKPAIPSIIDAFSTYEVVGIDAGHGDKDLDDFILALIRNPSFPGKVNDIAVECGNTLYQPMLDRYIAGEQISFTEVDKVWRNTTQPMCGLSAFYEQLFPLVRAINQAVPPAERIRVLATDPPIDWSLIHNQKDFSAFTDRDGSIASVMEKEVLSKHRKALMLFGIFHLLHRSGPGNGDAVTLYEKKYPRSTFVISDLGYFGADPNDRATIPLANWPYPSLIYTHGTSLGALSLDSFLPAPVSTDDQCNVVNPFEEQPGSGVAELIDAFLYLGPQNLRLKEATPADVALDTAYTSELLRRNAIVGLPGPQSVGDFNLQIIASAANPILTIEKLPDAKAFYPMIRQLCLERKKKTSAKSGDLSGHP
jgi:hypothetical protein